MIPRIFTAVAIGTMVDQCLGQSLKVKGTSLYIVRGGGGSPHPPAVCSIHLDDVTPAILCQNAHHSTLLLLNAEFKCFKKSQYILHAWTVIVCKHWTWAKSNISSIFWMCKTSTVEGDIKRLQCLNLNYHNKQNTCRPEVHSSCKGTTEKAIVSNTRSC